MAAVSTCDLGSSSNRFPIFVRGVELIDESDGLRFLAEPRPVGDKVKCAIERAAKAVRVFCADFSSTRAFDVWYRKARRIREDETIAIIDAIDARETKTIRDEVRDLRNRLEKLEN